MRETVRSALTAELSDQPVARDRLIAAAQRRTGAQESSISSMLASMVSDGTATRPARGYYRLSDEVLAEAGPDPRTDQDKDTH